MYFWYTGSRIDSDMQTSQFSAISETQFNTSYSQMNYRPISERNLPF